MTFKNIGFHWSYVTSKTPKIMLAIGGALLAAAGILFALKDDPLAGPYIKWMVPMMVGGAALTTLTKRLTPTEVKETAIEKIADDVTTAIGAAREEKIQATITKAVDYAAGEKPNE